ncbi:hypothetical protein LQW54_012533 [Pestalotiopsis sp. IQ-011]
MTQGRLIPGRNPSCELDAIEFVPLLSNYRPALDYCSSTFPITHSSVAATLTTTVIVPPNGIITLSGDVDGGTQTISGPTSTVIITSTVTNSNPTTLVATATSAVQRREARLVQLEHGNHHHDHGEDDYAPTRHESSYGSDGDETQRGGADNEYESYNDDYDSSGNGESVDGTRYPVMGSKSASTAAFSRLRALHNASRSFVCSCLEKHGATYSPSPAPPALTKTATVTSTDEDLPLIPTATADVRWTQVSFAVQTTTVTSTKTTEVFSGTTIACIADPSSNILINGGFDDNPGNEWHEVDPTPWGYDGGGWRPTFEGPVPDAQTPPNYAFFPGDDDGATFRMWQDSTSIDIRQNYTVSFWYQLYGLTPRPYNPNGRGPCPFSVTWGDFTIFTKNFDQGDASSEWKHVNSPIDLSPQSPTARLEFDLYCDPDWLGEGSVRLFIDSVAIYPSSGLVCDEAT